MHREVDRLLEPKGSVPISLQAIAISATNYCGQAIKAKLLKSSPSNGRELARDDQAKTEHRAFSIGLELERTESDNDAVDRGCLSLGIGFCDTDSSKAVWSALVVLLGVSVLLLF